MSIVLCAMACLSLGMCVASMTRSAFSRNTVAQRRSVARTAA